ncbi:Glycerol-3-phosphate dehydrogenase [NAD(P)+] [Sedimentisphaera cyanobacteriorum]|uniref:Glycerol-3-phosphate dehydrogenase [NAD(P)+] n=1 Tax=Sedimentisphaera cyanobacteriorum TaxID=1940790 RepID=A0A1Q2HRI9_9BACT|nr:NAD(P)H-dependent glycerol-3-phosphate dehydrogenase [Sedimentisphaera cyanobacteriorum]AQQ10067.1 Glycerol-3-phosphate dehydrogenase [NAD(P)+] [Sedimentisphaera cyanobacteriorum]
MYKNITIIGDGAMATACSSNLCSKGFSVTMWGHNASQLAEIEKAGENFLFLPGFQLDPALKFDSDDASCMRGAELIISAVPCQFCGSVWKRLKPFLPADAAIVSVTKGIENDRLLLPTQIIETETGGENPLATLSGPNIADELMQRLPASASAACEDENIARRVQQTFTTPWFRVYSTPDVIGVQVAGASKNVIAIAAGIIDGIGAGDNAKAALLARGLAEISRLGKAMGADPDTFAGLTGLGDLVTTCISPKGRNRSFGEKLGRGMAVSDALAETNSVVEGVSTCDSVVALAGRLGVEMPIAAGVQSVIKGEMSVDEVIASLMSRELKSEKI